MPEATDTDKRADQLMRTYEALDNEKSVIKAQFQEVTDYLMPTKADATRVQVTPGRRRGARRYDSTGTFAADNYAAHITSTTAPRSAKWFSLAFVEDQLNESKAVKDWLQDCRDRMLKAFAASNFYQVLDESVLDLVSYNTDCMFTREKSLDANGRFTGFVFETWEPQTFVFHEGEDGLANAVYREFPLTAAAAEEKFKNLPNFRGFGKKLSQAITSTDKPEAKHQRFKFLQVIQPREFRAPSSPFATAMPYASYYVCIEDRNVLSTGGYMEFPAALTRYRRNSGDAGWGRGPGLNAMPDIRTLNEYERLKLKAMAKGVDPPLLVTHRGVVGNLRTTPSGITYVRKQENVGYLESAQNQRMTEVSTQEKQRNIKQYFHQQVLDTLIGEPTPNMTAFEFAKRTEIMQKLLGPTLGRLENEKFNRIIRRCFRIMLRRGAFLPAPGELQGRALNLDIKYVGPLARAQQLDDMDAMERLYAFGGEIFKVTQSSQHFDTIDADESMRQAHSLLGAPGKTLRSKKDVDATRKQREEIMRQQQELDTAEQASAAIKNIGSVTQAA